MVTSLATDYGYLVASKHASKTSDTINSAMERLTSGKRINSASDDAAGVAIASRMNSNITGMRMAIRNSTDAQAMINTAEGAMVEIESMVQRIRELAVQAANDTNNQDDRKKLQLETDQLKEEINRIAQSTTWAGQTIFNGQRSESEIATSHDEALTSTFQIGATSRSADNIEVKFNAISGSAIGIAGSGTSPVISTSTTAASSSGSTPAIAFAPTISTSVTDSDGGTNPIVARLSTSNTYEMTIDLGSYVAGATYSLDINGHTASITASTSDAYADNLDGITDQMVDKINALRHSSTNGTLGLYATEGSSNIITVSFSIGNGSGVITNLQTTNYSSTSSENNSVTINTAAEYRFDYSENTAGGKGFGAYTFQVSGVTVSVPALDAVYGSSTANDAPATYLGVAANQIEQALLAAGVKGLKASVYHTGTTGGTISIFEDIEVANVTFTNPNGSTSSAPTLTNAGSIITVGGSPASGDVLSATIDGTAVNTSITSSLTNVIAAAGQLATDINAASITGVTATNNGDGTISLAKTGKLSKSGGVVTVGSSLSVGDILNIDIGGTTVSTTITSSLTSATAAATQMVADIKAKNISGLSVTDNGNGTFTLVSGPSISEASGVVTVGGTLSIGDKMSLVISGTTIETAITSSLTTAGAAATQMVTDITAAGISGLVVTDNSNGTFSLKTGGEVSLLTIAEAQKAINTADNALQILSLDRARYGAISNRISNAVSNLTNVSMNTEISLGRIQDADYAKEMSRLTAAQIMEKASTAMMARANASKENILELLR